MTVPEEHLLSMIHWEIRLQLAADALGAKWSHTPKFRRCSLSMISVRKTSSEGSDICPKGLLSGQLLI